MAGNRTPEGVSALVHLGYSVPDGAAVEIPVRHMCITGQTQEAGKTTALEALITRSGLRAVTFVTKRGEASFTGARRIEPYFREQADWQFVASILEASRGEKLKFERAWIIRASKGARTLGDVHANVKKALADPKQRGMSADVYLTLDAYLEAVVPVIAAVRWAPRLTLSAGVNAVDLTHVPLEMQHLVIKSTLDWVLDHEENTVVVIPEAWKFLPEGRGTPVKRAAMSLIRQGAGLKNYVWLDSQDIGGVDKEVLRSVPVWILGVQREANEIKRTLSNIPAGTSKPKAAEIATLDLGQFFACWKTHVIKTYVQPVWLKSLDARLIAKGETPMEFVGTPAALAGEVVQALAAQHRNAALTGVPTVNETEAEPLRDDNDRLIRENADLRDRLDRLEKKDDHAHHHVGTPAPPAAGATGQPEARRDRSGVHQSEGPRDSAAPPARKFTVEETFDNEALYQAFRARLFAEAATDPALLRLLVERSSIDVTVTRKTVTMDGESLAGRIARLIAAGWYDAEPKGTTTTLKELRRTGYQGADNTRREMDRLLDKGFFTKEEGGYLAVSGMKVNVVEG